MTDDETMERTDLADLVRTRMQENGQGLRALAAACIDPLDRAAGPLWTRGTLENLAKGRKIKPPTAAQLRALAAGLDLPELAVKQAATAQFFEMTEHWNDDRDTRILIARIKELDEEGVKELSELAELVFRRREREALARGDSGQ